MYSKLSIVMFFLSFVPTTMIPTTIYSQNLPSTPSATPSPTPVAVSQGGDKNDVTLRLNERMPRWLRIGGEARMRFEGKRGIGGAKDVNDGYVMSRTRLDFSIMPAEQVTFFIQIQDSHVMGLNTSPKPSSMSNLFDLRQGYIDLKSSGKSGWGLRVGRQELKYGEETMIGAGNWGNTSRSFDAVKVSKFGEWYNIDLFASSVVVIEDRVFDKRRDGNNLFGMYTTLTQFIPKAEVSFFTLWKTDTVVTGEIPGRGDADTVTGGMRLVGKLPAKFDYTSELMIQRGTFASDRIDAYGLRARLGYTISDDYWKPRAILEFSTASGDKNPTDGVRGTFDQYYPTNHSKYGLHDVIGFRNIEDLRAGIGFKPNKKWKIDVDYHSFWLAQEKDGLYNERGTLIARDKTGTSGKHVGEEADLSVNFNPKEYITVGAIFSQWFPGRFWESTTPGSSGSTFYSWISYKF